MKEGRYRSNLPESRKILWAATGFSRTALFAGRKRNDRLGRGTGKVQEIKTPTKVLNLETFAERIRII
jgi:hypothetical protein